MKTLICGGIAIDDIFLPNIKLEKMIGGSAIYGSLASSLFTKTILCGVIGNDFTNNFIKTLQDYHIDISNLQKSNKPSFRWKGAYSDDLRQLTVIEQNMNAFNDFKLDNLIGVATNCKVVFVSNIDPAIQLKIVKNLPGKVVKMVDSMDLWIVEKREVLREVLRYVDIFFISENEANLLVQEKKAMWEIIEKIMLMGPRVVILKKGEYGLSMYGRMGTLSLPSYPLTNAIDPSGAGDSLGGAMAGIIGRLGRFDERSIATALFIGNIVASFVVEDYGIEALKRITIDEVINRTKIFLTQIPNKQELLINRII